MIPLTSTIISFHNYLPYGLFEHSIFPDGIDKELVIDTILINCGEFEPLFKDAEFMEYAVTSWSKKWFTAFERWNLALTEDYNPLHNYDRHEEIKESHDNATTNKNDITNNDINTNTKSAYNSNKYEPLTKSELSGKNSSDGKGTDKGTFEREAHLYGNIGVTTSATMLKEELEVRKNNLYNMIADCFAMELCIMLY